MKRHILALDQGTTSSRAIIFDKTGAALHTEQKPINQIYPNAGWVEHDAHDILRTQLATTEEVLAKSGLRASEIAALGITNQRETTILWNRDTGQPIGNAIVWQDRRTADECVKLRADGVENHIRQKTGLILDPYFSATKIAWQLENIDGARELAGAGKLAFGTVDTWLIWNLTGGTHHISDRTNASRTMLYNIVDDCWDDELLHLLNIPRSIMPDIVWSSEVSAEVTIDGPLRGIPIAGIAGDQQSALFGQFCVNPGDVKTTYGTGCFLLQNIGTDFKLSSNKLITTIACSVNKEIVYALEGSVFVGGAVVQWLRDNMRFFAESDQIETMASSVESPGNVMFVPAFTGLGAPHWDPYASGLIIGIDPATTQAQIARAALESIAFQVTDVIRAMNLESGSFAKQMCVDGGASANDLLMQFQADLLQSVVYRPAMLETTAAGAAYLAGLAVGLWSGISEIQSLIEPGQTFNPLMSSSKANERYTRWQDAVNRSKGWNISAI